MLRFTSLMLKNFGPFKGYQEIAFPKDDGVVFIIGNNMRGKTSLLNAVRFGLLGTTLNRDGRPHRLVDLINDEAKLDGDPEMRVVLDFAFQGTNFRITRQVSAVDPNLIPTSDAMLRSTLHLQRDDVHLSLAESQREMNRILPPSLARFFLFDGELLQQYEQLVGNTDRTTARDEIVEAIEKILAVPVLTNARSHLSKLQAMAQRDLNSALARDKRHQKLAEEVTQSRLESETLDRDLGQNRMLLEAYNARAREIEDQLRENEALIEAISDREKLLGDLARTTGEIDRERERLAISLPKAWRDLIVERVSERAAKLQEQKDNLLKELGALQQRLERVTSLRKALESHVCPTCAQPLSHAENRPLMEAELDSINVDPEEIERLNQNVATIGQKIKVLLDVKGTGALQRALDAQVHLDGLTVDHQDIKRRIDRVNTQIDGSDGNQVSSLQAELQKLNEARGVAKRAQEEISEKLQKAKANLNNLQSKVPKGEMSAQVEEASAKLNTVSRLYDVIDESVSVFRESLKREVERRATEMFLSLTTEPEYDALCINENYGLVIRKMGGATVNIRSAGAEHIVAFSLISALQANSPRPGPVFIDSPFGRLDEDHSNNVVKALPSFSGQVVLLVFERELDINKARNILAGSLLKEFRLKRESASHTTIVEA